MANTKTQIKIAHSPDSDDAFMFYAIAQNKIDLGDFDFDIKSAEIAKLNKLALSNLENFDFKTDLQDISADSEIIAVSFHAYAYLAEHYQILRSGASMGSETYGPRLVSKSALNKAKPRIAVPGKYTSAFLVLQLYLKSISQDFEPVFCGFEEVFNLLASDEVDASLLIHESQLKFSEQNFELIQDLGNWWFNFSKQETGKGLAMPLGCNVVRRDLGAETISQLSSILAESIRYGLDEDYEGALAYARDYSENGLDDKAANEYISMYVNNSTRCLSEGDLKSISLLLLEAQNNGLINSRTGLQIDPI